MAETMRQRDGERAFPVSYGPDGRPGYSDGMSLRDYFAGQALVGMLAYSNHHGINYHSDKSPLGVARQAYEYADAMLAAREVSHG